MGAVNNAWHDCAGQEVNPAAVSVQTTSCSNRKKSRGFQGGRNSQAIRLFNNEGTTAMVVCFQQIHYLEVNYSDSSIFLVNMTYFCLLYNGYVILCRKCCNIKDSASSVFNLTQSFGRVFVINFIFLTIVFIRPCFNDCCGSNKCSYI